MKLIRCQIENFGGLSGYSLEFAPGITEVREQNGFGKTTLAEFIRAMLYGFPRTSAKMDLRKKFQPWQGGNYGGSLIFEHQGVQYRLQRTFGDTPGKDRQALYDITTGRKLQTFFQEPVDRNLSVGVQIFQLDADSFERCVYMKQFPGLTSLNTDSIRAKLGDLVEDSTDANGYDKAWEALHDCRAACIGFQRSQGEETGSVAEARREAASLTSRLRELRRKDRDLESLQNKLGEWDKIIRERTEELEDVRTAITGASEEVARAEIRRRYAELERDCAQERKALDALSAAGIPPEDELSRWMEAFSRVQILNRENGQIAIPSMDRPASEAAGTDQGWEWIAALLGGTASIVLGGFLLSLQDYIPGALLLALGTLSLSGGACLLLARRLRLYQHASNLSGVRPLSGRDRERMRANEEQIRSLEQSLAEFAAKYGAKGRTPPEALAELRLRRGQYDGQAARVREAVRRRDAYREEQRAALEVPEEEVNLTALRREKERLETDILDGTETIRERRREADMLRRDTEQIPELEEQLQYWKERQREDEKKSALLDQARGFLEQARENLSLRYLNTVRLGFDNYAARMLRGDWPHPAVQPDLSPAVEREGEIRDLSSFSAGESDLLMFCMRLALADALFQEEKAFLILDDPFVNLDDGNAAKARHVLQSIARDHQIVYLTCGGGRSLAESEPPRP